MAMNGSEIWAANLDLRNTHSVDSFLFSPFTIILALILYRYVLGVFMPSVVLGGLLHAYREVRIQRSDPKRRQPRPWRR